MSDTQGTQQREKAAKVKRKPERESVLQPTFAAARHSLDSSLGDRQQQGSGFLQRRCACGMHTIGGGACNTCRQKRESRFLQRVTVRSMPESLPPTPAQTSPTDNVSFDLSQVPSHGADSQDLVQPKFRLGSVSDSDKHETKKETDGAAKQATIRLGTVTSAVERAKGETRGVKPQTKDKPAVQSLQRSTDATGLSGPWYRNEDQVAAVQQRLIELGHLPREGYPNGRLDNRTRQAVLLLAKLFTASGMVTLFRHCDKRWQMWGRRPGEDKAASVTLSIRATLFIPC